MRQGSLRENARYSRKLYRRSLLEVSCHPCHQVYASLGNHGRSDQAARAGVSPQVQQNSRSAYNVANSTNVSIRGLRTFRAVGDVVLAGRIRTRILVLKTRCRNSHQCPHSVCTCIPGAAFLVHLRPFVRDARYCEKQGTPVRVRFVGIFWFPHRKFSPSLVSKGRFCTRCVNSMNGFFVALLGRGVCTAVAGLIEKA